MSFPPHASYKDSGVTWLGEVPSHWDVKRLRFVAALNPSRNEVAELPDDVEVSFIPMEAVGEEGELDLSRTRPLGEVRNGYSYFADGDVVFAKVTPCLENGKGALMRDLVGAKGFGTTELTVLRPTSPEDGRFLWWLTKAAEFRGPASGEMIGAGGLKRVPDQFVANFAAPWPPAQDRQSIADFLDRETAKIDALVEAQRRLIALLKEKRQAVISHAVTKGLDPSAPLKPSGIPWLGDVPAHWKVTRLKFLGSFGAGAGFPHEEQGVQGEEIGFYKVAALRSADEEGFLIEADHSISCQTATRLRASIFPPGAIVFAKIGAALMLARFRRLRAEACLDNNMMGFAANEGNDPSFLRFVFETYVHLPRIVNPGAVPSLNESQIADTVVAVPALGEQEAIVLALEKQLGSLADLRNQAEAATTLLAERRAALISAAVTGKIDVRGLASAEVRAA